MAKKDGVPNRLQQMMVRVPWYTMRKEANLARVYFARWKFTKYVTRVIRFAKENQLRFQQEKIIVDEPRFLAVKEVRAKTLPELKHNVAMLEESVMSKRQLVAEFDCSTSKTKGVELLTDVEQTLARTGRVPTVVLNAADFVRRMALKGWSLNDAMILRERLLEYLREGVRLVKAKEALAQAPQEGFSPEELLRMANPDLLPASSAGVIPQYSPSGNPRVVKKAMEASAVLREMENGTSNFSANLLNIPEIKSTSVAGRNNRTTRRPNPNRDSSTTSSGSPSSSAAVQKPDSPRDEVLKRAMPKRDAPAAAPVESIVAEPEAPAPTPVAEPAAAPVEDKSKLKVALSAAATGKTTNVLRRAAAGGDKAKGKDASAKKQEDNAAEGGSKPRRR